MLPFECTRSGTPLGSANPGRIIIAQEPLDFRREGFLPSILYLSQHSHFSALHGCLRYHFTAAENAPLPTALRAVTQNHTELIHRTTLKNLCCSVRRRRRLLCCSVQQCIALSRSFGTWLSPYTLSAQERLTSELLRFL